MLPTASRWYGIVAGKAISGFQDHKSPGEARDAGSALAGQPASGLDFDGFADGLCNGIRGNRQPVEVRRAQRHDLQ